ncbi:MAG: tetratricopeptide repeat protein [Acidobacteria bacterium]|nr:tetratricopeptide repeat protein [Acidobacteriota bacterium]
MPLLKKPSTQRPTKRKKVPTRQSKKAKIHVRKKVAARTRGKASPPRGRTKKKARAQKVTKDRKKTIGRSKKIAPPPIKSKRRLRSEIKRIQAAQAAAAEKALAARKKDEKTLLDLYERGIKSLYNKNYQQAMDLFEKLIAKYPEEVELADRARNFVKICQSQGATRKLLQPKTADEMFDLGVIEHNRANYQQAIDYFQRAIELNPKANYLYYTLAASYSQAGDMEGAIRSLQKSVQLNPDNKFLARNDPDFEPIRSSKEFSAIVEVPKAQ